MSTVVVLLFASEHRHKMSAGTSLVYKHAREHYPISYQKSAVVFASRGLEPLTEINL
jgi:hypothetical protein